jgi:hypothetical protein
LNPHDGSCTLTHNGSSTTSKVSNVTDATRRSYDSTQSIGEDATFPDNDVAEYIYRHRESCSIQPETDNEGHLRDATSPVKTINKQEEDFGPDDPASPQ